MLLIENSIIRMPEQRDIHKFSIVNNRNKIGLGENILKNEEDTMAKKKEKKGKR